MLSLFKVPPPPPYHRNIDIGEDVTDTTTKVPDGWEVAVSRGTGLEYYINKVTGESTYEKPTVPARASPRLSSSGPSTGPVTDRRPVDDRIPVTDRRPIDDRIPVDSKKPTEKKTEQRLTDTISSIRIPKINRKWKECISEIENVIDVKPTSDEYNNPETRRRIEHYKDRLGKELYECNANQQKKEEDDKLVEKKKRNKAQEDFEKRFESKYNLQPQSKGDSRPRPQQPQPDMQPQQPQPRPEPRPEPRPVFGLEIDGEESSKLEQTHPKQEEEKKEEKKEKGFFQSLFGKDEEEEEEEEGEEKEEMIDAINMYLKSQDPSLPQTININDVKGIDNLIENYKELVENHETLSDNFQKVKENQRVKNVKDTSVINEQDDTIENLTNVVLKLEKQLTKYRLNAEKKFVAQEQLNEEDITKQLKEKDQESREIHKHMQSILNERVDTANKIIKGLTEDHKMIDRIKTKSKNKKKINRTKKKKKPKKKNGK
jgi:hypothetical protein